MKSFWGHVKTATLALGVCAIASSSCVHNDATIFIQAITAPPTPVAGMGCTYTAATPSETVLFEGLEDVAQRSTYQPVILVANQLVAQADPTNDRAETSRVELQGAIVTVTDAAGNAIVDSSTNQPLAQNGVQCGNFTTVTAGFVDAAEGSTPGYGHAVVTLVDECTSQYLANLLRPTPDGISSQEITIVSKVKVFGQTLGGDHVESNEYQFPISVCYGCLIDDPSGVCKPDPTTIGSVVTPCNEGQDQPTDCRSCYYSLPNLCGGS